MKKILSFLIVVMMFTFALNAVLTVLADGYELPPMPVKNNEIKVLYQGEKIVFPDQKPVIKNSRTLVPLRAIFEAMGALVDWNNDTRTVLATKGDVSLSLEIGSNLLYKNGVPIEIDVPAEIMNDRTMVPVRAIAEAFGSVVDWDNDTRTVLIDTVK